MGMGRVRDWISLSPRRASERSDLPISLRSPFLLFVTWFDNKLSMLSRIKVRDCISLRRGGRPCEKQHCFATLFFVARPFLRTQAYDEGLATKKQQGLGLAVFRGERGIHVYYLIYILHLQVSTLSYCI